MMRLHDGAFEQMEAALMRCRASPGVLADLGRPLIEDEIVGFARVLMPSQAA